MDRVVRSKLSPDQKNLSVEAVEDIIDVEHEMGFGEGEDWGHENATGYSKLASRTTGLQKPKASYRPRTISPTRSHAKDDATKKGIQQKPFLGPRGVNLVSSSSSDASRVGGAIHRGNNPADKDNVEHIITDGMPFMGEGGEESEGPPQHRPYTYVRDAGVDAHWEDQSPGEIKKREEDEHINHSPQRALVDRQRSRSPQTHIGTPNGIIRRHVPDLAANAGSKHANIRQRSDRGSLQRIDSEVRSEKRQERMRNASRVRFSLDLETAEKLMNYKDIKKGIDVNGEENIGKNPESFWEDSTSIPTDNAAEKELPVRQRAVTLQRRKEPLARDARKDLRFDLEKAIEMKEDKKAVRLAQDRIERLEEALLRQQEIAANMRVALVQEGLKEYGKLRQLLDALEKNIRKLAISRSRHFSESYQLRNRADQVQRLKAHCNMLETDRERLKKKLEQVLESTKDREEELTALIVERDRLLEHKATGSEEFVKEWESKLKKVEARFTEEKAIWEEKLNACQSDWTNKKQDWAMKLKEKEAELCTLKTSQENLIEILRLCKQGVDELKDAVRSPREDIKRQNCGSSEAIDALELARSIYSDTESLKVLLQESPFLLKVEHTTKQTAPLASLEERSNVLDEKLSKTLQLADKLKQDMESKEGKIRQENASYEHMIAEKVQQVDALEKQLAQKEHSVSTLVNELKNEVSLLSTELHQECTERSGLSVMQEDVQQKLIKGLEKRECEWEEEIEVLKGKLDEMGAVVALKDGRIDYLEEEVKAKADQLAHEKQKWDSAIKEVKQRAAKTILCFVNGKENGLLEQLRERRQVRKASEGHHKVPTCTVDEEDEGNSINKGTSSLRDQIHNTQSCNQERPQEMLSPRELHPLPKPSAAEDPKLRNVKRKHDRPLQNETDKCSPQADCMEDELFPKSFEWTGVRSRGMDKKDVLNILERQKSNGNTTFALLQSTVQDLE